MTQEATQGIFDDPVRQEEERNLPVPVTANLATSRVPAGELGQLADLMRVAQDVPARDINALKKEAKRIGRELKTDGYYSFPAGGGRIEGATVWLMEALEGAWRYTFTQVQVDRVDGRRVHLRARFVDLMTGVIKERPSFYTMSDPPGKFRGKPDQEDRWHSMQLASATSKAARSVLEHGLPSWFTETAVKEAMAGAREDLLKGRTLDQAIKETLAYFEEYKVTQAELEALVLCPVALWVDLTILELRDLARSLKEGRTTVDATFGPLRQTTVTASKDEPRGASLGLKGKP